ncbi:MAG: hypothetical protein LBS05_06295 [Tannerellaceae bacterium]|nr:hypothetical protein [Tannerellaceae bacterium]
MKVKESLLGGKNVILSVPTGAGKTWASIIPFLRNRNQKWIKMAKSFFEVLLIFFVALSAVKTDTLWDARDWNGRVRTVCFRR